MNIGIKWPKKIPASYILSFNIETKLGPLAQLVPKFEIYLILKNNALTFVYFFSSCGMIYFLE